MCVSMLHETLDRPETVTAARIPPSPFTPGSGPTEPQWVTAAAMGPGAARIAMGHHPHRGGPGAVRREFQQNHENCKDATEMGETPKNMP